MQFYSRATTSILLLCTVAYSNARQYVRGVSEPRGINLSNEELQQLKQLAYNLKNQDPDGKKWGTAQPLIFYVQDIREEQDYINDPEYYVYVEDGTESYKGVSSEEMFAQLQENDETIGDIEDEPELLQKIEEERIPVKTEYETKRVFLTYNGAKKHIEQNHYHYSSKVRIWCDHSWRNPEMELVQKLILQFLKD